MTQEQILQRIDLQWENKERKTDWLGLEATVRDILALAASGTLGNDRQALLMIDEAVAAWTRRGNAMQPND